MARSMTRPAHTLQSDDHILIFNTAIERGYTPHLLMFERMEHHTERDPVWGHKVDREHWVPFPTLSVKEFGLKYGAPFDIDTHEVAEKIRRGEL